MMLSSGSTRRRGRRKQLPPPWRPALLPTDALQAAASLSGGWRSRLTSEVTRSGLRLRAANRIIAFEEASSMNDVSRRRFLTIIPALTFIPTLGASRSTQVPATFPRQDPALAREIVGVSHGNL